MLPIARVFGLTIQTPLLATMMGFALASSLAGREAARRGLDGNVITNALFYGLIAGVLGARIGYVLLNLSAYTRDPLGALALNPTALSPWTGWPLAVGFAVWTVRRKRMLNMKLLDILAPPTIVFVMGLALADFLSGNAFGTPSTLPWAVALWNASRHPVQVYEFITLGVILVGLIVVSRRLPDMLPKGGLALLAVALYAAVRILVDGFRANVPLLLGLRITQLAGVLIAATALWLLGEWLVLRPDVTALQPTSEVNPS